MRSLLIVVALLAPVVWSGAARAVLDPDKALPAAASAQELPSGEVIIKPPGPERPNPPKSVNRDQPIKPKPKAAAPSGPPMGFSIGIGGRPLHFNDGGDQVGHPKSGNDQPAVPKKKKVVIPQG